MDAPFSKKLVCLIVTLAASTNALAEIVPPDGSYGGRTYNEWQVLFWQNLLSIPVVAGKHPYLNGGAFDGDDGMLFLAQVGGAGRAEFELTILPDTPLFFQLNSNECSILEPPPYHGDDEASLRACANLHTDQVSGLFARIDGVGVRNLYSYRVESPLFEFGPLPEDNLPQFFDLDAPAGTTSLSVDAGIYLLLTPLSLGKHEIRGGNEIQDATFHVTVAPEPATPGDFDLDGSLTALDVDQLSAEIRGGGTDVRFDLNGDSRVDTADRATWVHDLHKTYFGDTNLDGQFNSTDMIAVFQAGQYEDTLGGNSGWTSGDWDGDGDFTTADLVGAFQDGGYEMGPRPSIATVPEPNSWFMCVLGFLFLRTRSGLSDRLVG